MLLRRLLIILVLALPVLTVAFGVLMAGHVLVRAVNDPVAAQALLWVAMSCLMLLGVDVLLLVGALGLQALERREAPDQDRDTSS